MECPQIVYDGVDSKKTLDIEEKEDKYKISSYIHVVMHLELDRK